MREKPKPGFDNDPSTPPLQRRTLLQLALAASAGAAVPAAVVAQTPTPAPANVGHTAALNTILNRATNFYSANANPNLPYKKIWSAAQKEARDGWFKTLKEITVEAPHAISADHTPHAGTMRPGPNDPARPRYDNTVRAAMLAKDQIQTARTRVQHLLLALEREAFWWTYQVAYRDGYCQAVTEKPDSCVWKNVEVKGLTPMTICDVEKKAHDWEANKLADLPPDLYKPDLCPEGFVFGHEGY
jgi:hypothetical protein